MPDDRTQLLASLEGAVRGLSDVHKRRMFGCDALFRGSAIFGLIWKTGRIGLKLTDGAAFDELMACEGSAPWSAGTKTMSHWVLVPPSFHNDATALRRWARLAYDRAGTAPALKKTADKKTARPPKRRTT